MDFFSTFLGQDCPEQWHRFSQLFWGRAGPGKVEKFYATTLCQLTLLCPATYVMKLISTREGVHEEGEGLRKVEKFYATVWSGVRWGSGREGRVCTRREVEEGG